MSNIFSAVCTVTRDAEVRFTPAGMAVLNVNVANNQGFNDKQKTMFIRVAVFGKKAESKLVDYLKKGQQVFVSGEISTNEYKSNDGTMKTSLELTANVLDLVGKKSEGGAPAASPAQNRGSAPQPPARDNFDNYDDDIPF
jgi:single-strand DNA-binding protein